jgi:hypothetical protein
MLIIKKHRATWPVKPAMRRARQAFNRATRYRGMLVIVLWQAPIGPHVASDGGVAFLFGGGTDEMVTYMDCTGPAEATKHSYRVAAAEFDMGLDRNFRVEGVAGLLQVERAAASAREVGELEWTRGLGILRVRGDWNLVGVGVGALIRPALSESTANYELTGTAYLRAGSAEQLHARADVYPAHALGILQLFRAGVGWNATDRDRPALFVGYAELGGDASGEGLVGEITLPVGGRGAIRLLGHYGDGTSHSISGLAVGGLYRFGGQRSSVARHPAGGSGH